MQHELEDVPGREGLSQCAVCGCAEGTLPTHCPRVQVPHRVQTLIHKGIVDYIGGGWNGVRFTPFNEQMQRAWRRADRGAAKAAAAFEQVAKAARDAGGSIEDFHRAFNKPMPEFPDER